MATKKGFSVMDKKRLKEICSKGGKRAHELKRTHRFTHEQAVAAGKKGGLAFSKKYKKK